MQSFLHRFCTTLILLIRWKFIRYSTVMPMNWKEWTWNAAYGGGITGRKARATGDVESIVILQHSLPL